MSNLLKDQYLKSVQSNGGSTEQNSTETVSNPTARLGTDVTGSTGTGTYDLLRTQNFKTLLDSEIQLSAAKQNAMKQTQAQINATGFGGTGYGGMAGSAVSNQYLTAMGNANKTYQDQNTTIATQEATDKSTQSNSDFQALTTLMSNATDTDSLNNLLTNSYQYGKLDSDGNFVWDDKALSDAGYSTSDINQLKATYSLMKNGYDNSSLGTGYTNQEAFINSLTMANGENANEGGDWGLQDEVSYLFSNKASFKDGQVFKLVNGKAGKTNYAYVVYKNGKFYSANATTDTSKATVIENGKSTSNSSSNSQEASKNGSDVWIGYTGGTSGGI